MQRFRSTVTLTFGFLAVALGAVLTMVICLFLLPWRAARVKVCNGYGKIVSRFSFLIGGIKMEVDHPERLGGTMPAIYISNHTSVLDALIAMIVCPFGGAGVSKKEIGNIPFFGWLYRLSGHLLIDRQNPEGAIAAMQGLAEVVRKNHLGIWIWPEGTRSKDGHLLPFKKGFAHMALATGLPIVPVLAENAHNGWEKGSMLVKPVTIKLRVLEPISTADWRLETIDEHIAQVWHTVADALPEMHRPEEYTGPIAQQPRLAANAK